MVIGAVVRPAVMNRSLAALLISWSAAMPMKSMIMISATGSSPSIAAPIAAPTIAASEMGVSSTRSWPYFVDSPVVRGHRLIEREVQRLAHRHLFVVHGLSSDGEFDRGRVHVAVQLVGRRRL